MINVYELHYGDTVKFTNGETATINTVEPSHFHDGCVDIEFDKEVTGYISGRRGGEKRRVWCYEQNGNFANYRGKQNCIVELVSRIQDYNMVGSNDKTDETTTAEYLIGGLEDELRNSNDWDKAFNCALRLFSLALGIIKQKPDGTRTVANNELSELCDADDECDYWYPCKFKNAPWRPMQAMAGVCSPYRFRSQESCMKAIAKLGDEKLNQIYGLEDR